MADIEVLLELIVLKLAVDPVRYFESEALDVARGLDVV